MKKRLLIVLPIAFILSAVLLLPASMPVMAQQSRSADSLKASPPERSGRSSARDVGPSRRTRDASRTSPSARPADSGRTRSSARPTPPLREETHTESRRSTSESARTNRDDSGRNVDDAARGRSDARSRNEGTPRGSAPVRGDRTDRTNEREIDNRRADGDYDGRGNRGNDRRADREDDRRDERYYDRRDERNYDRRDDRRRDGGHVIISPRPQGNGWARPRIHIDIDWPWIHRHQRRWSPRYRYRQVVYVDAGWDRSRRESRLDLRTYYRHRVREASPRRAVVDIQIDRIEIYEDGFFVGEVRTIPSELAGMRAVVDRQGGVRFDRDVFLLGDPYAGFEIISTRHYDGFILNKYRERHGIKAGVLDLHRERVVLVRRSRFFDPRDFSGFVPINLLPEDAGWLIDYGYDSYSGHYWGDDDRYYYGLSDVDEYSRLDGDRVYYNRSDPQDSAAGRERVSSRVTPEMRALERSADRTIDTDAGARIRLKRDSSIERVD